MALDLTRYITLGPLVADLRKRTRLQLKELAERTGTSYYTLSKLENNKLESLPSAETLQKLGEALGASADEIAAMLRLAKKAPAEVQQWVREEPAVTELYRTTQAMSPEARAQFLQDLVAAARAKLDLPDDGAPGTGAPADGAPR